MHETREALLKRLEGQARQIRRNIWRALRAGGSGHAGGSSSAADILAALYFHRLCVRPKEPDWPERDRFVLSKGHANAALGAALAQAGFIEDAVLDRFYGFDSPFGMHPDIKVAGVEMCTGALGHGLAVAMGMALGARIQKQAFHSFVMLGDGELHEGSNWEALMSASQFKLSNLTAIVDLTLSRIDQGLFTGTRWECHLTELELQWGRTIGQYPSPCTAGYRGTPGNPLTTAYHWDQGP